MLQGGIDPSEYAKLQRNVSTHFHTLIEQQIINYDGDIRIVRTLIDDFMRKMPNPCGKNKLLEHEILPIRLGFKIEDVPIKRIEYSFNKKPYVLWVYGREFSVYTQTRPSEFTLRLAIELIALLIIIYVLIRHYHNV